MKWKVWHMFYIQTILVSFSAPGDVYLYWIRIRISKKIRHRIRIFKTAFNRKTLKKSTKLGHRRICAGTKQSPQSRVATKLRAKGIVCKSARIVNLHLAAAEFLRTTGQRSGCRQNYAGKIMILFTFDHVLNWCNCHSARDKNPVRADRNLFILCHITCYTVGTGANKSGLIDGLIGYRHNRKNYKRIYLCLWLHIKCYLIWYTTQVSILYRF